MSTIDTEPRTIIVCLPAGHYDWWSVCRAVEGYVAAPAIPPARFPVRHRRLLGLFTRWSARALLGAERRFGVVTHAVGGRRSRLDLRGTQQVTWYAAAARWGVWRQVTDGLRQATGWREFLRRHQAEPDKLTAAQAREKFLAQPMIAAMLAYNANPASRWELDPYEVEAYLAGSAAYATSRMLASVCGDAMLTADGRWLSPDGDSFADQCAYLKAAAGHLHRLSGRAMVVAMTT